MMDNPFQNPLKGALSRGEKTLGGWLQMASPISAEIMAQAGFDWLVIDMEHGPGDVLTSLHQMQAMNGSGCVPLVRAPWNDFVVVKRILDAGAYGILFPYINSREEAEAAVAACRYPPEGIRGTAGSPRAPGYGQKAADYLMNANGEILTLMAVETGEAVQNLDEILSVSGVDGIFIGPMDLATSLGHMGNPAHEEVQETIAEIEARVRSAGKVLSTIAADWEQAEAKFERGYQMLMVMADGVALAKLAAALVGKFRPYRDGER